jgi:FkbM family methyltransferase
MIPKLIDGALLRTSGPVGAYYSAYKTWRWGDPYVRLVASLVDRRHLAIDIGAHLGDYTFFMRRHAGGCVAFECNPMLAAHLRRRFGHSVDIRSDAVSDHAGTTTLRIPRSGTGPNLGRATIETANALSDFSMADLATVTTVRLDDVINHPVGLIKIDVEGHEFAVLRGAERILTEDRPNLILELEERHAPGCVTTVSEYLDGFGYRGFVLRDGKLVPVSVADHGRTDHWNYVFQPAN